jgi:hypothetical protein
VQLLDQRVAESVALGGAVQPQVRHGAGQGDVQQVQGGQQAGGGVKWVVIAGSSSVENLVQDFNLTTRANPNQAPANAANHAGLATDERLNLIHSLK